MIVLKRITTDAMIYSVLPQMPRLLNLLLLPVTTPYLTKLDFAIFGTVMAYTAGFELLKGLGLEVNLMNVFFQKPQHYKITWQKIQFVISVSSVVLSILIGLLLYTILPSELTSKEKIIIIVTTNLSSVLFAGLGKIGVLYYQYNGRPFPIVIRSIILGFLAIALNYYTIVELRLGYMGWFVSGFITSLLLPLSYIYPIWIKAGIIPTYKIKWQELKSMLSVSLPLLPHQYSSYFLNYSDRVLLNAFQVPTGQVGLYNLAYSVSGNFRYVTTSIDKVIGPLFHRQLSKSEQGGESIKPIVDILTAAYILIGFLGGLWMKEGFQLLIRNEELLASYSIGIIILFSFATRPLYNGAQSFLFFNEKTKNLWKVTFMSGVLNVALNIIFIPKFGIMATAVNTLICIAASHYGIFLLDDYKKSTTIDFKPLQWILITSLFFGISWVMRDSLVVWKAVATLIALAGSLFGYVFLTRKQSEAHFLRT